MVGSGAGNGIEFDRGELLGHENREGGESLGGGGELTHFLGGVTLMVMV